MNSWHEPLIVARRASPRRRIVLTRTVEVEYINDVHRRWTVSSLSTEHINTFTIVDRRLLGKIGRNVKRHEQIDPEEL